MTSVAQERKMLFTPCFSKEHFQNWIRHFLKIDLPDCTVVTDESNSNPLDAAWEYYDRLRRNDLVGCSKVMTYACRGGFKTLSASVLETMALLHTTRNIGHMAAIEAQSKKSASYIKDYFRLKPLSDFVEGDNAREIKLIRYVHQKTGDILTSTEFSMLPSARQADYARRDNYLKIVVCTMSGANSEHVEFFVVDEVDVVPKQNIQAYYQAQNIPDPRAGLLPLTLLTSTRKSRIGLVQREIDDGERTGLQVKHWNLIDITQACQPNRHRPDLPRVNYWVNDDSLTHIIEEEYQALNPGQRKGWYQTEGFAGCRSCKLFAACKGRLATAQKSTSKMLKPIEFAIAKFQQAPTPEFIQTEYLCRKPDTSGLVYPRLNDETHRLTAGQMAALVEGEGQGRFDQMTKMGLIALLARKGAKFYGGMDFGFTHNFALVIFAVFGQYVFVIDCYSQSGLELDDQTQNTEYIKELYGNPPVYADPAYPGSIKTFKRRGFRMKDWEKKPHSVKAGIEIVRSLIFSGSGLVRLFFLRDDAVDVLWKHLKDYKFQVAADGRPGEEPDEENDDEPDALRYGIMNVFGKKGAIKDADSTSVTETQPTKSIYTRNSQSQQGWMVDVIRRETGQLSTTPDESTAPKVSIKKKGFIWDG